MNKDQEIKDIETQQRALADRLAKLQEPEPKREPRAGEVWTFRGAPLLMTDERRPVVLRSDRIWDAGSLRPECLPLHALLGTFNEVYMLRSEAPEPDDLWQKLLDWRDSDGDGIMGDYWPDELIDFLRELFEDDKTC